MSPVGKIAKFLLRLMPLQARYEAARWSLDRSYIPGNNASATQDIDSGTRLEIMRRARYFEKNHAVVSKILDLIETNVVGTGINPTAVSSGEEWNKEAMKRWATWVKVADLASRQDFYALQAIIARAQAVDGEIFAWMTKGETGNARIQLIEAHRCVDGDATPILKANPKWRLCDGIVIDERGRPQYYLFSDDYSPGAKPSTVTAVPASEVVHFFEPSRAGQLRGLSIFHSVLHTLHDLDDLQRYEMIAAKDAASRVNVVKTESGEIPNTNLIGRSLQQTSADGTTTAERIQYFERAVGGKTISLKPNESFNQTESNRPSPAMREFWEYLTELVCKGVGVSFAAVQDYKGNWGGAALRGAVISDNRFYEIRTRGMSIGLDRIWQHVNRTDIVNKSFYASVPADWSNVIWHSPRRASVDIGYESASVINDLRGGIRTFRDVIGQAGGDWREVKTQRADELAFDMALEKARGLPPGSLSVLFPNPPQIAASETPQSSVQTP